MTVLHGENGVTYSLFTELEEKQKVRTFLELISCENIRKHLDSLNNKEIRVHIFPSFGRKEGPGEPDAVITTNKFVVYIEVKIDPGQLTSLAKHVILFESLGRRLLLLKKPFTYPITGSCLLKNWQFKGRKITLDLVENELIGKDYCVCCITPDGSLTRLKFNKGNGTNGDESIIFASENWCHMDIREIMDLLGLEKTNKVYRENIEK